MAKDGLTQGKSNKTPKTRHCKGLQNCKKAQLEVIKSCDSCTKEEKDCDFDLSLECHSNDMKHYKKMGG